MPRAAATALAMGIFGVLPAMAATCPGIVAFQDAFLAPNAAYRSVKPVDFSLAIKGGNAEANFQKAGISIPMQYMAAQFGDVSVCATVSAPATDKAEDQSAGVIFWAASSTNYYCFEVSVNGQFIVAHQNAPGDWDVPLPWEPSDAIKKGSGGDECAAGADGGRRGHVFSSTAQQVGTRLPIQAPPGGGTDGVHSFFVEHERANDGCFGFLGFDSVRASAERVDGVHRAGLMLWSRCGLDFWESR